MRQFWQFRLYNLRNRPFTVFLRHCHYKWRNSPVTKPQNYEIPNLRNPKLQYSQVKNSIVGHCISFFWVTGWGYEKSRTLLPVSGTRKQIVSVPWQLRHPPVGHCDTLTRTIRHCNDSPHKHFHIETIRPHRGRTVQPHPNCSVRPLRRGSKCWLWQSDPFSALHGGLGDSSGDDTQMALLKNGAAPPERTSPTYGSAGRKLDLT
jgi:hypothetical protein